MNLEFTKMHGIGNDFIVINNMDVRDRIELSQDQIKALCDRHKGIGADGVILVEPSERADCFMNYYNADGTLAEICGNGVRCTAKFALENLGFKKDIINIETRAGVKEVRQGGGLFAVNMGRASLEHPDFPAENFEFNNLKFHFVALGNPFAIAFASGIREMSYDAFASMGRAVENNQVFKKRINMELVEKVNSKEFKVRVWERGCGETLACGSGACAVYRLVRDIGEAEPEVNIDFPGGRLVMSENEEGEIIMRGPAEAVFTGVINLTKS